MDLASERGLAQVRIEMYRMRFAGMNETFVPIRLATRWFEAVMKDEIDERELAEIRDEAMKDQNRFDVSFFTFCNHMDSAVRDLSKPLGE